MNKMWVISLAVLLAACANNSKTLTDAAETASHSGHNNSAAATADTSTTTMAGGNAMMDLHQVMNGAMQQMKTMQPTGDADHDFAMMMQYHHQNAVDMAKIEVSNGINDQMKTMAQKMIDGQQGEISQFDAFLQNHQPSGRSDYGKGVVGMMTEMSQMKMKGGTLDAMFASMMIPHHQDAVKMAKAYMKEAKSADLKAIARNIITTQPKEVAELKSWLSNNKSAQ